MYPKFFPFCIYETNILACRVKCIALSSVNLTFTRQLEFLIILQIIMIRKESFPSKDCPQLMQNI